MTTAYDTAGIVRVLAVLFVALLAASGVATAHGGDDGMHHHDGWMGTHGGWMGGSAGFGWFLVPLFLLALGVPLALGLFLLGQRRGDGGSGDGDGDGDGAEDAMAVLRRRYAAGDVDDEEFERRRERLRSG